MTTKERILAAECDNNFLWTCMHPEKHLEKCPGPCDKGTYKGKPLISVEDEKK